MTNAEWRWWFLIFGFVGLLAMALYLISIARTSQMTPEERHQERQEWVDKRFETIQCSEWRGLCLCLGKTHVYGAFAFEAPPVLCVIEKE